MNAAGSTSSGADAPRVSVVMPMRNAAKFVEASARSVLEQEGVGLELVVIDDGSTDDSAGVVQRLNDPRVKLIPGPQKGIAAALNTGLEVCRGDVFVRCDSDDLLPPGRLQQQLAFLDKHPEYAAVCGGFQTVDPKGTLVKNLGTGDAPEAITGELKQGKTRTHFGTFATRTGVVRDLGGARDYFIGTEDVDLQLRIGTHGPVWYEPGVAYTYRLHHASSTHTQPTPQREFLTEQARRFARQRAEAGTDDLEQGIAEPPPTGSDARAMHVGEQIQGMLISRAWSEVRDGHRAKALRSGWSAVKARPASPTGWVALVKLAVLPALGRGGTTTGATGGTG